MHQKLDALKKLYECIDDFLQLPLGKQGLPHKRNRTIRAVFSWTEEYVQELQSSLRMSRNRESCLVDEIRAYFVPRKMQIKLIRKCSKNLKPTEKDMLVFVALDSELVSLAKLPLQVQKISQNCFKSPSHLAFVTQRQRSKQTAWSLVKKVLQNKGIKCEGEAAMTELEKIDIELGFLQPREEANLGSTKM